MAGSIPTLDIPVTAIYQGEFFVGHSPLFNQTVIASVSFQRIESCLDSTKHGSITLTNDNSFRRCLDDGTTNLKLPWILLQVVIGDGRVLICGYNTSRYQQLDDIGLILQDGQVDTWLVLCLTILVRCCQIILLDGGLLHTHIQSTQVSYALNVLRIPFLDQQRLTRIEVWYEVYLLFPIIVNCHR